MTASVKIKTFSLGITSFLVYFPTLGMGSLHSASSSLSCSSLVLPFLFISPYLFTTRLNRNSKKSGPNRVLPDPQYACKDNQTQKPSEPTADSFGAA